MPSPLAVDAGFGICFCAICGHEYPPWWETPSKNLPNPKRLLDQIPAGEIFGHFFACGGGHGSCYAGTGRLSAPCRTRGAAARGRCRPAALGRLPPAAKEGPMESMLWTKLALGQVALRALRPCLRALAGAAGTLRRALQPRGPSLSLVDGLVTGVQADPVEKKPPVSFPSRQPDVFRGQRRMQFFLPVLPEPSYLPDPLEQRHPRARGHAGDAGGSGPAPPAAAWPSHNEPRSSWSWWRPRPRWDRSGACRPSW